MNRFAALLERLVLTPARSGKLRLMRDHFARVPDPDRGWALAAITGDLTFTSAKPAMLRTLITERMDPILFELSYDYVGDLAETISLAWPQQPGANRAPTLGEVVDTLNAASRAEAPGHIARWLDALDAAGRWALLKLVTRGLRIGVSARLAKQAAADFGERPVSEVEELWHALEPPYADFFAWLAGAAPKPSSDVPAPFRPVMLANPLIEKAKRGDPDAVDAAAVTPDVFAAEWKWDGVRVQAVGEAGVRRLYTRTGEDISATFPDLLAALDFDAALDGELLVRAPDGAPAPFNDLQQRLNRKTVTKKQMHERPAFLRAYDLLQHADEDLRASPFRERRARLEAFIAGLPGDRIDMSELVAFDDFAHLQTLRAAPPRPEIEGLMLKRWDSLYEPGRPKGPWFKWKRDPYLVDAVLLYAQRGHGKRSSYYSDFTFGVWRDGALVPVGKAYFGFTDAELLELDRWVRAHSTE
ncbi:MAG: cisplatin damage response ATP-dependent DNA ligase, partial [Caulobacterales bacterium]|nr:cisplatin damage response ATP-dependent DNA ligase [Caulobacterales bacterium]